MANVVQAVTKQRIIGERRLINKPDVDVDAIKRRIHEFSTNVDQGSRILMIEERPWKVDYSVITSNALALTAKLEAEGAISIKDIWSLTPCFMQQTTPKVSKTEEPSFRAPVPCFVTRHINDSTNWPVKDSMPGGVIYMGDTKSGKTTKLRKLDCFIVRYGEPFEDVDLEDFTIPAGDLIAALDTALVLSALGCNVAIDSLRLVVYALKGNPMEGGVIASLFELITQLNNFFADLGFSIGLAINPMLADESKATRLASRIEASCAGLVHIVEREVILETYRLVTGRVTVTQRGGPDGASVLSEDSKDPGSRTFKNAKHERSRGDVSYLGVERLKGTSPRDQLCTAYGSGFSGDIDDAPQQPRPTVIFNL